MKNYFLKFYVPYKKERGDNINSAILRKKYNVFNY